MEKSDIEYIDSVPASMQRLVKLSIRGFYGVEFGLAADILIKNKCVKEEDIQQLLKFDKKQLRAILNSLKSDKFLKSRIHVEAQPNGKQSRHNYFFINYRCIANVIKYKLHKMLKMIESRERDWSNRPSFKCNTCGNSYGDLEVNKLLNVQTGLLNCTFCREEVVEEKDSLNSQDIRTSLARFNEQTEQLYKLLKDVQELNFSADILEPKPSEVNLPSVKLGARTTGRGEKWSKKSDTDSMYSQSFIVNIGDDATKEALKRKSKEMPVWITNSTVTPSDEAGPSKESNPELNLESDSPKRKHIKLGNTEVINLLISNERPSAPVPSTSKSPTEDEDSSDDDVNDFEDVEDDDCDNVVLVAGKPYSYHEVAQRGSELIALMSSVEKSAYIEMGQRLYQDSD